MTNINTIIEATNMVSTIETLLKNTFKVSTNTIVELDGDNDGKDIGVKYSIEGIQRYSFIVTISDDEWYLSIRRYNSTFRIRYNASENKYYMDPKYRKDTITETILNAINSIED